MPKLRSSWAYVQQQMNTQVYEDCIRLIDQQILKLNSLPRHSLGAGIQQVLNKKEQIRSLVIQHFKHNAVMLDDHEQKHFLEKINAQIENKFKKIKKKAVSEFNDVYDQIVKDDLDELEDDLLSQKIHDF